MKTLRIFLHLCSSAFIGVCFFAPTAHAQCPALTTVADTLHNADGSLAEGRLVIAWQTFAIGACPVPAGQATVQIVAGALSVQLFPNDAALPAGTSYRVTYFLRSGRVTTEYWVVPASAGPVALAAVRSATVPVPNVMFSQSQVTNLATDLARKLELPAPCPAGKFLQANGASAPPQVDCVDGASSGGGGSGTVTSVALAAPSQFNVSGSPVTTSGTLGLSWADQAANVVLAGPASGGAATPGFRALLAADVPALDAAKITTGAFSDARVDDGITLTNLTQVATRSFTDLQNIPSTFAPEAHALAGSVHTASGLTAGHYLRANSATTFGFAQVSFSELSGSIAASQQNNPGAGAKGGVEAKTCGGTDKLSAIGADGVPVCSTDQTGGGANHELLSSVHSDTAVAAVQRGAGIFGTGASPAWSPVTLTAADRYFKRSSSGDVVESSGAAAGTGSCSNQFVRAANADAAPTCATVAKADVNSTIITEDTVVTRDFPLQCANPRVKSLAGNAYFDVEGLATGDYDMLVAKFTNNVDGAIQCSGFVPHELAATPTAKITFDVQPHAACGSSQNFRFNIRYRFYGDGGDSDAAMTVETEQSVSGSTTAHRTTRATFPSSGSLSSAPAAGNNVQVEINRAGSGGSDTCEQIAEVLPGSVKLRVDVKVKN